MKKVIIILGGKSGEHEVSVNSALAIEKNIDKTKFKTRVIGIAHNGSWIEGEKIADIVANGKVKQNGNLTLPSDKVLTKLFEADVIFPVIHGTNGEDGTIQGLLDIANLPYVGSGVLGSAVCMDKVIQKQLCSTVGIPQTNYTSFTRTEWEKNKKDVLDKINNELTYPLFVKPANLGSSVGISKVKTTDQLEKSITEALLFDNKIIVEAGLENIMEIEISILGNETPQASVCGSIAPNTEFYDYETKYVTDDISSQIPAQIEKDSSQTIKNLAIKTYLTLNCEGLARIDFFYDPKNKKVILNEVNTMPGFTKISMYPKLWIKSGISYQGLITKLIKYALDSWQKKQQLKYTY